mmetsp:Transcript_12324/g.49414  ORF Transcript_12324/g.49414 Transcript_12324/m.49414 type:complete len:539 (-) Transcript_12324:37-1653(-)
MYPNADEPEVDSSVEEDSSRTSNSLSAPLLGDDFEEDEVEAKEKSKAQIYLDKAQRYLMAHLPKAVIGVIWLFANLALFLEHFIYYYFQGMNLYVMIARGFGQMLNFNCALILIPVLRNVITALRQTFLYKFVPFDSNIMFHRRIAWMILFAGYGHGVAHYFNYGLQDSPYAFAWGTLAGITGNLLVFVMIVMYTSAIDSIRRRYFNVFYFAHHLFIVFFLLLLFHGPRFWIWFVVPGTAYTLERIVREWRAKSGTTVREVTKHPSDVVEVRMERKKFKYKSGQYLFLNAPNLSFYEWHPFTITSAPHEDFVSVHIRAVGKWTKGLRELLAPDDEGTMMIGKKKGPDGRPLLRLDGPYGAASEEVFTFETVLLVGAGIGVTPFASILKSLYHKRNNSEECKVKKVYFFWICRDFRAFEWFHKVLNDLEEDMRERGEEFLEINLYLTQRLPKEQLEEYKADQEANERDPVTGLLSKTHFGRPDFDAAFEQLREAHPNGKVGLFFCGPRVLSKNLRKLCMEKTAKRKKDGTRFVFHKENF